MREKFASQKVFVCDATFAQTLLVRGKLNRRPLDMSGCNYFGVEKILSQARVKLEEGTILIVPISNMVHWYLAVLVVSNVSNTLSVLCSMGGHYKDEEASLKVYVKLLNPTL
ncbi:uncharacterized protein LOC144620318 [Crassostrea virginica]